MSAPVRSAFAALALLSPAAAIAQDAKPRVAVTGCAVVFALQSSGSSATRAGLFAEKGRSDVKVTKVYRLTGTDSATMQQITDRLCTATDQQLTANGYEVVTAEFEAHKGYADFAKKGSPSGRDFSRDGTKYLVFTPAGKPITIPQLAGGMGAQSLTITESGIANAIKARALRAYYVVDFADVSGRKDKGGPLVAQNTASVSATVQLAVDASLSMYSAEGFKCWERFGKVECNPADVRKNERTYDMAEPKTFDDVITAVEDVGSGAGKAAMGVANAVAMMAGTTRQKLSQYEVTVDPAKYAARTEEGAMAALIEGVRELSAPPAGKKKK
jgi:hypothetical protein